MDYTATCHTEGCGNAEAPIPMTYDETNPDDKPSVVVCGVCGQVITDTEGLAP